MAAELGRTSCPTLPQDGSHESPRGFQGRVKVDWVETNPSPTALRSPLSLRARALWILAPCRGRGGTARRWVTGRFADYAFVALSVYWMVDFGGAPALVRMRF
jgi:hypothetical protein